MAVNRANNDLVVLATVCLGLICFRLPQFGWRLLGVAAFAVAAVMKYYPLVTVLLLLELRSRMQRVVAVIVYAAVLLVALPGLIPGLASAGKNTPVPEWLYAFGAPTLWRDLGSRSQAGWMALGAAVAIFAAIGAMRSHRLESETPLESQSAEREFFVAR